MNSILHATQKRRSKFPFSKTKSAKTTHTLSRHQYSLFSFSFWVILQKEGRKEGMELAVMDLAPYLSHTGQEDPRITALCGEVSRMLRETGALLVKDPRCSVQDNDRFIDMMERYFSSPHHFKLLHERPHLHFQV